MIWQPASSGPAYGGNEVTLVLGVSVWQLGRILAIRPLLVERRVCLFVGPYVFNQHLVLVVEIV